MMTRREFLVVLSAGALVPHCAMAQRAGVSRVGWISLDRAGGSPFLEPLRAGLRDLGYVEGRNLVLDARWGDESLERLGPLAAELVRSQPHVIVTQGPSVFPVRKAGAAMPVVFGFSGDPVEAGLVDSLARPGRNYTGVSFLSLDLVGKRMELLKEMMPALKRVAIIARPEHPGEQSELRVSQAAAKSLGLAVAYFPIKSAQELDDALAAVPKSRSEAIVAFPDAVMMRYSERIAAFSVKSRVPAISGWAQFAEAGNVMTYGPVLRDSFRRLAYFVDKILKGARPAELPVELPTSVELVVNTKSAKALGIAIPRSIVVRADRVIE
jgi:putative ABC transport system substrate-binding protein